MSSRRKTTLFGKKTLAKIDVPKDVKESDKPLFLTFKVGNKEFN